MYSNRGWSYSSAAPSSTPTHGSPSRRRPWRPRLPHPPSIGPLPFAILLVLGVAWYHFAFAGFSVRGQVVDNETGQPIAGARVWSAHANTASAQGGAFTI